MLTRLQLDTHISQKIHQQAALAHLGTPLRAYSNRMLQIINILCLCISIASALWLAYTTYAYFAFIPLVHQYPTLLDAPPHQLDQYFWFEILHDEFRYSSVMNAAIVLGSLLAFFLYRVGFNTKIYICTHGLLKIEKKKVVTIHWHEVRELRTKGGSVILLMHEDNSRFTIDDFFYRYCANRKQSTLIADEVSHVRLPQLIEQFNRGETIAVGAIRARKQGLYQPDTLLPWNDISAVKLHNGQLRVFGYQLKHTFSKKALVWSKWIDDSSLSAGSLDLPLFTALINAILEQKDNI